MSSSFASLVEINGATIPNIEAALGQLRIPATMWQNNDCADCADVHEDDLAFSLIRPLCR
jgi:hypothetical protein